MIMQLNLSLLSTKRAYYAASNYEKKTHKIREREKKHQQDVDLKI